MDIEANFGSVEDLVAELSFRLSDVLSLTKLLANSTCHNVDFEIDINDVNKIALTLHDKSLAANLVVEKLRLSLENFL